MNNLHFIVSIYRYTHVNDTILLGKLLGITYSCSSKVFTAVSACRKGLLEFGLFSLTTVLFLAAMAAHSASNGSSRIEFCMLACQASFACKPEVPLLVEVGLLNPLDVPFVLEMGCKSTWILGGEDTKDDILGSKSKSNIFELAPLEIEPSH